MTRRKWMLTATLLAVIGLGVGATTFRGQKIIDRVVPTTQTIDATPFNMGFVNVPDACVLHAQAIVTATDLVSDLSRCFKVQTAFSRNNGILTQVGSKVENSFESGDPTTASWKVQIGFDDFTDQVYVTVTGSAGNTIDWMGVFDTKLYQP